MGWLLPVSIGLSLLGLLGRSDADKKAKKQYAADKAMYEEQLRAQKWKRIENLLHGGMGVDYPIQPPTKPYSAGMFDYLSAMLPALQFYMMFNQPASKGTNLPTGKPYEVNPYG